MDVTVIEIPFSVKNGSSKTVTIMNAKKTAIAKVEMIFDQIYSGQLYRVILDYNHRKLCFIIWNILMQMETKSKC